MVTIVLPAGWTEGRQTEFAVEAGLLPEVIKRFVADHPDFRRRLLGPDEEPLTYINFCVNEEVVPRRSRAGTVVRPGSTITVMAPMAGG